MRLICPLHAGQEGEVRVGLEGFNAWGYVVRWYHLAHVKFPRRCHWHPNICHSSLLGSLSSGRESI